jgi:NADH dehydrogenase (ubiquinone) 1 beta subcomplex subunit 9
LVAAGEATLAARSHPDPYTVPYRPGGTLYARNPGVPAAMHQQLDFGREEAH